MCLEAIKQNFKETTGRFSRRKILCMKEVMSINRGRICTYYQSTPLVIGKWMTDKDGTTLKTERYPRTSYITGYHAYIATPYLGPKYSNYYRLVMLTDIVAIGRQWGMKVAVGRKMFIFPRKQEKSVIAQWNKRHPKEKII